MRKTTVCIFEDDHVQRFIYSRLLTRYQDQVEAKVFSNLAEGAKWIMENPTDVVMIELHFLGDVLSGLEILKKLKDVSPKPFMSIAMTSLLQPGDAERALAAGFTMCVEKPISLDLFGRMNTPCTSDICEN